MGRAEASIVKVGKEEAEESEEKSCLGDFSGIGGGDGYRCTSEVWVVEVSEVFSSFFCWCVGSLTEGSALLDASERLDELSVEVLDAIKSNDISHLRRALAKLRSLAGTSEDWYALADRQLNEFLERFRIKLLEEIAVFEATEVW